MTGPIGEHNIRAYLMAFADGELDAAANLAVLDHLAEHPEALELMRDQQRLRIAAARAAAASTPPVPSALRLRLEAMAVAAPAAAPETTERAWWASFGGSRASVAAGFLVAGLLLGRWAWAPEPVPPLAQFPRPPEPPVPVNLVALVSRDHAACSRLDAALHAAAIPQELAALSDALKNDLDGGNPYPDFTAIGYRYIGAGPCPAPLDGSLHLLYYSTAPGPRTAISVFVESYRGQFRLEPGKLYTLSGDGSPFPFFAWRTTAVVYFLIADTPQIAEAARGAMSNAPRSPAVRQ